MGRSLLRLLSIWEQIEETAQKTSPIAPLFVAHRFEKRCPWFFISLPMVFENIAHHFGERWATFFFTIGNKTGYCVR
ncbi:hypothetical protein JQM84_00155 [Parabacteroides distasonis]|nr:hypothetical protein [Parabacteroides distasonis]